MDSRAQVSFEYLLTVAFGIILVVAAFAIALQTALVSEQLKTELFKVRDSVYASLISSP